MDVHQVAPPTKAKVRPLAPERFKLELTLSGEATAKLERARALMRHKVPSGDLAQVIELALDALVEKVEARKWGKVKKPLVARASRSRRHVPAAVRREVVARDGERCAFVSDDGRRCREKGFLELDHVVPVAQGGGTMMLAGAAGYPAELVQQLERECQGRLKLAEGLP